jgi:hypothetical protein
LASKFLAMPCPIKPDAPIKPMCFMFRFLVLTKNWEA